MGDDVLSLHKVLPHPPPYSPPRCVYYVPRSVKRILCHPTYCASKGKLPFRARRQLDQAKERRGQMEGTEIVPLELESYDGVATKAGGMLAGVESGSVDVVVWSQISDEMKKFYGERGGGGGGGGGGGRRRGGGGGGGGGGGARTRRKGRDSSSR